MRLVKALRTSEDGKRVLVLIEGTDTREASVAVATIHDGRLTGPRWECSPAHLDAYAEVYAARFPVVVAS